MILGIFPVEAKKYPPKRVKKDWDWIVVISINQLRNIKKFWMFVTDINRVYVMVFMT